MIKLVALAMKVCSTAAKIFGTISTILTIIVVVLVIVFVVYLPQKEEDGPIEELVFSNDTLTCTEVIAWCKVVNAEMLC